MRIIFSLAICFLTSWGYAQIHSDRNVQEKSSEYRPSYPKINAIVHTKLEVNFDFDKSQLIGREWLTVKPYFYPTDSIRLDAKGMEIKKVMAASGQSLTPLRYTYDGYELKITLDKTYTRNDQYTLYFEYVSKPNELKMKGSAAITDAKGLYFINPKGEDKNKPTQIWTQGETESNSTWMITIDKPDQKTTQEITMTVPENFVTLSNGLKTSEKSNGNGTRTDVWKMDLPHAPYLIFMGVGDYAIVKDTPYKGKEVSYYVDKKEAPYAKAVFGNTPEMMEFFSKKLCVDYPWQKYTQIVGQDYVSGAMENTTATLHQNGAYQNFRQLVDGNAWENVIAHELFHHWFGDLVTTESWSNLTMNESFANYSEYLWNEYKYGKDAADKHAMEETQGYLMSGSAEKDLVRFYYNDKEDMFDAVSYNKGGRILHMLRNYVGDEAFFKALNLYLNENKFGTGEAHQFRLALEKVTGKDLNWFFNQWYFGKGHPEVTIDYKYADKNSHIIISQNQKTQIFNVPITVDIWKNGKRERSTVMLQNAVDTFYFSTPTMPDLINVDADKTMLWVKKDNQTTEGYKTMWKYAQNYFDRKEALDHFSKNDMAEMKNGLKDPFYDIRKTTIFKINRSPLKADKQVVADIENMATNDNSRPVRAEAIAFLGNTKDPKYKPLFLKMVNDSSYKVAAAALQALKEMNEDVYPLAKQQINDVKDELSTVVMSILMDQKNDEDFYAVAKLYDEAPISENKIIQTNTFIQYLGQTKDANKLKKGIDAIANMLKSIPGEYKSYFVDPIKQQLSPIGTKNGKEIVGYIEDKIR